MIEDILSCEKCGEKLNQNKVNKSVHFETIDGIVMMVQDQYDEDYDEFLKKNHVIIPRIRWEDF